MPGKGGWVSRLPKQQKTTPERKQLRPIQDTPDLESKYFKSSSANKNLYCGICTDLFKKPMRAPCGHSFCHRCISTWLKMNKICPQDRRPLTMSQLHHDFILDSLVSELDADCPFSSEGCKFIRKPLSEVRQHALECPFNPENVPDFIRDVLTKHNEECYVVSSDSSDDNGEGNGGDSSPLRPRRTHREQAGTTELPEEPAQLPLRLRLLRSGTASVDQLREVVGYD